MTGKRQGIDTLTPSLPLMEKRIDIEKLLIFFLYFFWFLVREKRERKKERGGREETHKGRFDETGLLFLHTKVHWMEDQLFYLEQHHTSSQKRERERGLRAPLNIYIFRERERGLKTPLNIYIYLFIFYIHTFCGFFLYQQIQCELHQFNQHFQQQKKDLVICIFQTLLIRCRTAKSDLESLNYVGSHRKWPWHPSQSLQVFQLSYHQLGLMCSTFYFGFSLFVQPKVGTSNYIYSLLC